jgi:hypothetical protein
MKWDKLHWKEHGLWFLLCEFQNRMLIIERGAFYASSLS